MSSIVCQGLQSCLESRTLSFKLASQPSFSLSLGLVYPEEKWHHEETAKKIQNQVYSPILSNRPQNSYFKPLTGHSSSTTTLSEKSLELCTETLGCETGTDLIENMVFTSSYDGVDSRKKEKLNPREISGAKKSNSREFPPPLTTISSSDLLRVKRHREGGRLIIEAVVTTSSHTCFQAERRDGRLMLSVLKDTTAVDEKYNDNDNDNDNDNEAEHCGNDENDEEEDGEEMGEMNGNSFEAEGKIGIRKLERGTRCIEDGRGDQNLLNWEPFWVSTS